MNTFKDFGIKTEFNHFIGDKIKMAKIIGKPVIVHAFKLKDSTVFADRGAGKCLHLQIELNGEKHVAFTGSTYLIQDIQKIPVTGFPFQTTIMEVNETYKFT
jgi:hypothetical protein